MIRFLHHKFTFLHLQGILVFDAHLQPGSGSREHGKTIEVVYTSKMQTADEAILDKLQELKPSQWTVVTSDKRLALKVRRAGFKTEEVDLFLAWLKKKRQKKRRLGI